MNPAHWFWWFVSVASSIVALVFAYRFYKAMIASDEGDESMKEIAGYVRDGANAYLWQQYQVVGICFIVLSALLGVLAWLGAQHKIVPIAFLTGGFFSGLSGWFGMQTATRASNRTAAGCRQSLNRGLQIAFRSGAVMGLVVVGLGLLDIALWFAGLYLVFPLFGYQYSLEEITVTMLCFGMGASTQALFARVGGGIFTKAADVGADLVGKVEAGIPEDDPRNPATIADNVGDNVGDVAGMGADLYESYCGSILASAALGVAAMAGDETQQLHAILLPMALAGVGILLSILGIYWVRTEENADQATLLKALARGINLSCALIFVAAFGLVYLTIGRQYLGVAVSVVVGLIAGWVIGKWTEYCTSDVYKPTRDIADQAPYGPATVIIAGVAEGMYSTWVPAVTVCAATILAFGSANGFDFDDPTKITLGLYGIGLAAVGMLSTLGITLATDAYGPIADNAGGNAQMTHQEPYVRQRTDALDSLGNTTAATGKGFAIGSAALTALALLAAYVEEVRIGFVRWAHIPEMAAEIREAGKDGYHLKGHAYARFEGAAAEPVAFFRFDLDPSDPGKGAREVNIEKATMRDFVDAFDINPMNPKFLVGLLLGAMMVFVFCALTMKAVGRAAGQMVGEVRRQFKEKPGIMQNTDRPDYAACVQISTKAAQREMIVPSLLALAAPVVGGYLFGVGGVMGILAGATACGFCMAVMMANAGGAWDNAKKFIEGGAHGGKGSDAHKAGVVGDTVGDPFKDTSGPSLNILIKLMSMVSVVAAGFIVRFTLGG